MDAVFAYIKRNYYVVFFTLGILIGIIYFLNLSEGYMDRLESYSVYFSEQFTRIKIADSGLILSIFGKRIREMILLYLIGYTSIHISFGCLYCCYVGFCNCIYIYVATVNYGASGLALYGAMIFPQCLLLVPMALYALKYGGNARKTNELVKSMIFIAVLSFIEAVIEVMAGYNLFSFVIQKI